MRRLVVTALGTSLLLLSVAANAQTKKEGLKDTRGNALGRLVMLHDLEATRQTQIARGKMKAGDCKAAIDGFDAALKGSNDPSLRRDRGICHEKLGHPYPAIEDYRAYLTALPEAPDSNNIRERLDRLQSEVKETEPAERGDTYDTSPKAASGQGGGGHWLKVQAKGSASGDGASGSASASGGAVPPPIETSKDLSGHDAALVLEKREAADTDNLMANGSALRRGSGPVLGVIGGPRFFSASDGGGVETGFLIGGTLRYSMNKTTSLVVDLGYSAIEGQGTASSAGGLMALGGVEFRVPLDPMVNNSFIAGIGLGYERYKVASQGLVTSVVIPRGRIGFRHVFGPSFGLEATVDAGAGYASVLDTDRSFTLLAIGPNLGLVTAF